MFFVTSHRFGGPAITSVESGLAIDAILGTSFPSLDSLPSRVRVQLEDSSYRSLQVTWQVGTYNGNVAGVYNVTGLIDTTGGRCSNPSDITASLQIEVYDSPVNNSKLVYWFDNTDTSRMNLSGTDLLNQTDQTGNYLRKQVVAGGHPQYDATNKHVTYSVGSTRAFRLRDAADTANQVFTHQTGQFIIIAACNGTTNFLVGQGNDNTRYFYIRAGIASVNDGIGIFQRNNDSVDQLNSPTSNDNFISSVDEPHLIIVRSNGTTTTAKLHTREVTLQVASGANNGDWLGDSTSTIHYHGRDGSANLAYSNHREYQILYFNNTLTATEEEKIVKYLYRKMWGEQTRKQVYIMEGQSNEKGNATSGTIGTHLYSKVGVKIGYTNNDTGSPANLSPTITWRDLEPGFQNNSHAGDMGREMRLGYKLARRKPSSIHFIRRAWVGTALAQVAGAGNYDWNTSSSGELFAESNAVIQAALAGITNFELRGWGWMQGETDRGDVNQANAYEANGNSYVKGKIDFLENLGYDTRKLRMQWGRIHNNFTVPGEMNTVRTAQQNTVTTIAADPVYNQKIKGITYFNTDAYGLLGPADNNVHWDAAGVNQYGLDSFNYWFPYINEQ